MLICNLSERAYVFITFLYSGNIIAMYFKLHMVSTIIFCLFNSVYKNSSVSSQLYYLPVRKFTRKKLA